MGESWQTDSRLAGGFEPIESLDALKEQWRALEAHSEGSFFVSWSWIGPWLRRVQPHSRLRLYVCREAGLTVALGIVSEAMLHRRRMIRSRILAVNEVTRPDLNMFVEYNGLLARSGYETRALQQLIDDLAASQLAWDELQITNVARDTWLALQPPLGTARLISDVEHTTWIAPLDGATDIELILGRMSSNRRSKLRRSIKEYEKQGPLAIDAATSPEQALEYFRALGVLHTQRWNRVGEAGSFSQPHWIAFHEDLITSAFARGEIQLLRIRCGERAIGYLYNFLYRNCVLMLQSGFASESSNLLRPGYLSHMLAMQFNARNGATRYDFLIGDSDYKVVLAEPSVPLVSGRVQCRRVKFLLEDALVRAYRRARGTQTEAPAPTDTSEA